MPRTFRTSDGYTFFLQADGTVADHLDPAQVDMTYASLAELQALTDAVEIQPDIDVCLAGEPALAGICGDPLCVCAPGGPLSHLTLTGPQAGRTLCGGVKDPTVSHYHAMYAPPVVLASPRTCPDCVRIWEESAQEDGQ